MLEKMRTHSRNWLIYLLFGAIILVFAINFGPGFDQMSQSGCGRGNTTAATVNGEEISRRLFLMQWRNFVQMQRLTPSLQGIYNKNRVLDQLIRVYLFAQKAREYGVLVPESEVQDTIIKDTNFHRDGIFSPDAYKSVTSFYRLTPGEYADYVRTTLQAEKIRQLLYNGLTLSDEEVKQAFEAKYDKVTVRYAMFDADKLTYPATFSAAKADAFAKKHPERLKKYYDANLDKFTQEKQVRARHILLTVPPKATAAQEAKIRKQMEDILKQARKAPKSFPELAKKHSQGPSKVKGGDLGYFTRTRMVPPFSKAAFNLKKVNDISDIVKTRFGFHIIQLTGVKPEKRETLAEQAVKRRIAQTLMQRDKTKEALKQAAEQVLAYMKKGKKFKEALALVKKQNTVLVQPSTQKVPAHVSPSKPGKRAAAPTTTKPAVARKAPGKPTTRQAAPKARIAARTKPTTTTKPVAQKKEWLAPVRVRQTSPFPKESDLVPPLKDRGALIHPFIRTAFLLNKKNPLPEKPLVIGNKVYVLQFKKRTSPKSLAERFAKEKDAYRERLLTLRRVEFVSIWNEQIRQKAKIFKNANILKANYQY